MMRYGITVVFCLALLAGKLSGQNFSGGAYGGLLTSQANGDGLSGFSFWGFHLGAYTNFKLGDHSDIKLELAFLQKGSRQVPDSTNNFQDYKLRTGYIEIPLLYRIFWGDLSFEAGPALDINVSQFEQSNGIEFQSIPEFNRFHLAAIFGINYHFNENWYLNFRSNWSITPARDAPSAPGTGPFVIGGNGIRFIVLSTGLVYQFN